MTIWNQIRTDKHWSGEPPEVYYGTATYDPVDESWDLEAGKVHYLTERGGWVDGYRPKQMRISFTGGTAISLYVYRKEWLFGQWYPTTVISARLIQSGERVSLEGLTTDLMQMLLHTYEDETPTVTNIAFSDEAYTELSYEQETWSDVNWSGENWQLHTDSFGASDEEVYSAIMNVASGVLYFVVTTRYSTPYVYANYGIKYENGQWTYISKNESTVNSYGEDWDKYIGGYPADGMVVMNNGVANMYYAETGEIYVYQNYNMEGPPIRLDQTTVGYDRGWAVWGNSSVGAIYSSIMHTNMGNIIIPYTDNDKSQIWYMQHYWNDPFTANYVGGGAGSYDNACMHFTFTLFAQRRNNPISKAHQKCGWNLGCPYNFIQL
jgi:hypothetical protein